MVQYLPNASGEDPAPGNGQEHSLSIYEIISHPEDLQQRIVQDPDIIIDQHALVCRAALADDAEEGEVTRGEIRQRHSESSRKNRQTTS